LLITRLTTTTEGQIIGLSFEAPVEGGARYGFDLNNRCEVSHQPARRRERHMRRFNSVRPAQQFLASHTPIHNHFQLRRHRLSANEYRTARDHAFATWRDATGAVLVG
jgi:putative transposase